MNLEILTTPNGIYLQALSLRILKYQVETLLQTAILWTTILSTEAQEKLPTHGTCLIPFRKNTTGTERARSKSAATVHSVFMQL